MKFEKNHLTKINNVCIIIIGNGETTNVAYLKLICKNTSNSGKFYRCVFLLVYLLLLKITTNSIIKAIAMIVTPINE